MKQLLMLTIIALFLILVAGWGQQVSALPLQPVDHFKCYKVSGKTLKPAQTHTVDDQFEKNESDTIGKPALICNPVRKTINHTITKINHTDGHLACYQVKGQKKLDRMVLVQVNNQFGTQVLKVAKMENLLCVPSLKTCLDDYGLLTNCPNEPIPPPPP